MNSMPYTIFIIDATVEDDHYDEPRTKERLEEALCAWLKTQKLKVKAVRVTEYLRGMK